MVNWNPQAALQEISDVSMEVLEEACQIIVAEMKSTLYPQIIGMNTRNTKDKHGNVTGTKTYLRKEHGPYKSGKNAGKIWTARDDRFAMIKSIRYVKKKEDFSNLFAGIKHRNIWIMAGNYKTWWATQMEYGHGQWRGGARPFFRVGINKAMPKIAALIAARNALRRAA